MTTGRINQVAIAEDSRGPLPALASRNPPSLCSRFLGPRALVSFGTSSGPTQLDCARLAGTWPLSFHTQHEARAAGSAQPDTPFDGGRRFRTVKPRIEFTHDRREPQDHVTFGLQCRTAPGATSRPGSHLIASRKALRTQQITVQTALGRGSLSRGNERRRASRDLVSGKIYNKLSLQRGRSLTTGTDY